MVERSLSRDGFSSPRGGKRVMVPKFTHALVKTSGDQGMVPTKSHSLLRPVRGFVESRGCATKIGGVTREVPASRNQSPVEHSLGMKPNLNIGPEQLKGREGIVNHAG